MREGLLITAAFALAAFLGWARAEWRIKHLERRVDTLADELGNAKHDLEWYRRTSRHPALRRIK